MKAYQNANLNEYSNERQMMKSTLFAFNNNISEEASKTMQDFVKFRNVASSLQQ